MILKEIKFKLTKVKDLFTKPTYVVPEEEIIKMDYECGTNDYGKKIHQNIILIVSTCHRS